MRRILLIPLDERPCNYDYTAQMLGDTDFTVVLPPKDILPNKKERGNADAIFDWAVAEAPSCYGAIISVDALVYTGIVPSRLHTLPLETMLQRIERLRRLKDNNPSLKLYAFSLIMRCPRYSSSDEEPDYYEDFGREIHRKGYIEHKLELNLASNAEKAELEQINKRLPREHIDDYLSRRKKNIAVNKRAVDLTADGVIDFLIIPQDDSAPYGYTARDQKTMRAYIAKKEQQFGVYMYPDADAVESTLAARLVNYANNKRPMFYLKFASAQGGSIIPPYEDRPVLESIKYQILAAGGLIASSAPEADIILMLNTPGGKIIEASDVSALANPDYAANRTLIELVEYGEYMRKAFGKIICYADIGVANGGDQSLFELLKIKNILFKLGGYAGWNTSSNSLGTAIPMSIFYMIYGSRPSHINALAARYVEDIGYMSQVRGEVRRLLPDMGLDDFHVDGQYGEVSQIVWRRLSKFADENLSTDTYSVKIRDCRMPWSRTFEVGVTVEAEKIKEKHIYVSY